MAAAPQTGIKNADLLITLADAHGLIVTVETTDRETLTSYVVRISVPVPPAYAGTELGRTIAGDTLTLLWTKAHRPGARGRLEDATACTVDSHRKLRTLRRVIDHVRSLGHQSAEYVRNTAPKPEDVIDAPHTLFIDGKPRGGGVSVNFMRHVVRNRRQSGRPIHQDRDGAIVCENRRYVPQPAPAAEEPAPAVERYHFRSVNGGTPVLIPTRDALAEINHAMMGGRNEVREMSESRAWARIVYKNRERGTVELRPAHQGETLTVQAQRPTVQELTGPVDDGLMAQYAETYAAVADGTAIPVRADMIRPGMDVIAAVRLEDRTVATVKAFNGPSPWVSVTWTIRNPADSLAGDTRVFARLHHLMVTVDSLERLYGAEEPAPAPADTAPRTLETLA